jgi:osmotically-inducible protein OsmY
MASCASDATRTSAGEVVDDSLITAKVKTAFVSDKEVNAMNIGVETKRGVVELTGAGSATEKSRAAQLAQNVAGVKAVRNKISVQQ